MVLNLFFHIQRWLHYITVYKLLYMLDIYEINLWHDLCQAPSVVYEDTTHLKAVVEKNLENKPSASVNDYDCDNA